MTKISRTQMSTLIYGELDSFDNDTFDRIDYIYRVARGVSVCSHTLMGDILDDAIFGFPAGKIPTATISSGLTPEKIELVTIMMDHLHDNFRIDRQTIRLLRKWMIEHIMEAS